MLTRRTALAAAALAPFAARAAAAPADTDWHALGRDVRAEMAWAWDHYRARRRTGRARRRQARYGG